MRVAPLDDFDPAIEDLSARYERAELLLAGILGEIGERYGLEGERTWAVSPVDGAIWYEEED